MRLTVAMAVLAFVAVQAAAVPEAEPSLGIYARDADALAEADPRKPKGRLRNLINFCGVPGQACGRRRDAEPEADPKKLKGRLRNWINFCGVPGQACGKARDAPEQEVGNEVGFCSSPGEPCAMVKRSANAIAEAIADAEPKKLKGRLRNWINFCGVPGQACGKARDLIDNVVDHSNDVYGAIYEREAEAEAAANPEADPKKLKGRLRNWINFCGVPGQACGRRRDADAIADANEKIKRDPEAEADPKKLKGRLRNWINFCGVPGQACGKPRNAEAMAEAINRANPSIFKSTCFAEGGDCDTLLKIQKAFHNSKKANAEEKQITNPQQKLAHCGGKNECTILTHAHQYAKQHGPRSAAEEEEKCNGPEGLCTLARRDLEGIEKTIDEAVAAMAADQGVDEDVE